MAFFLRCDVKPTTIAICAAALCGRIQRIPLPWCSAYINLRDNRPFGRTVRLGSSVATPAPAMCRFPRVP